MKKKTKTIFKNFKKLDAKDQEDILLGMYKILDENPNENLGRKGDFVKHFQLLLQNFDIICE